MDAGPEPDRSWTHELLNRALAGDAEAERELFECYQGLLLAHARRNSLLRKLRGMVSAEDAVAEVWVRCFSSGILRRFQDHRRGALGHLLLTILNHTIVDEARRLGTIKRGASIRAVSLDQTGEDGDGKVDPPRSREASPTGNVRSRELLELCRGSLEPREWEIWRMAEMDGLTSAEIAAQIGIAPGSVRRILSEARKKLIRRLDEGCGGSA